MKANTGCTQPVSYSLWTESRQNRSLLSLQWDVLLIQCSSDILCWGEKRERPKSLRSHMEKQDAKLRQQVSSSQHLSQRPATGPWAAWHSSLGTGFWPHVAVLPLAVTNKPVAECTQEHLIFQARLLHIRFDQFCWAVVTESLLHHNTTKAC